MTENHPAQIEAKFADGKHIFCLKWANIVTWENENNRSLFATYRKMIEGVFIARDVRELIRHALIGGGRSPNDALKLVESYVEKQPVAEYQELVMMVLHAAIYGENLLDDIARIAVEGEGENGQSQRVS